MSPFGGIVAARRRLFRWFGGLELSAKAGIATAAFITMSAGVVIGVPFTPTSVPWLTPTLAPYGTLQTPSPLKPSMVEAATPTQSGESSSSAMSPAGPTSAPTTAPVVTTSRVATTMAPATNVAES